MLSDLLRFYTANKDQSVTECDPELSIETYLNQNNYSQVFRDEHLYPMCGALWSSPVEQVGQIPYKFVVSFFQHHRMLELKNRPSWQTVKGGSASYVRQIQAKCPSIIWKARQVDSVQRYTDHVMLETADGQEQFDWVVFASHADTSLQLLTDASALESEVLSHFTYQDNQMVVHIDE